MARGADGEWWVKFLIDHAHPLAWSTVQELAFVLNGVSQAEQLPTLFKPISPPPYLNGGPDDFLSWVIECPTAAFAPGTAAKWLEARMPNPIEALDQWPINQ